MDDVVRIFDTTLRDGEQSPGYGMTAEQKLALARQLDELGVDVIEAGFPAASPEDLEGVRQIARAVKRATIATLARCNDGDIEACVRGLEPADKPRLHLFFGTSQLHLDAKTGLDKKDALDLIVPQRFHVTQQMGLGDRHVYAGRSRFIPNRLLGRFEQASWPPPAPELQGSPASSQAAIDLAAKMRDMWR